MIVVIILWKRLKRKKTRPTHNVKIYEPRKSSKGPSTIAIQELSSSNAVKKQTKTTLLSASSILMCNNAHRAVHFKSEIRAWGERDRVGRK